MYAIHSHVHAAAVDRRRRIEALEKQGRHTRRQRAASGSRKGREMCDQRNMRRHLGCFVRLRWSMLVNVVERWIVSGQRRQQTCPSRHLSSIDQIEDNRINEAASIARPFSSLPEQASPPHNAITHPKPKPKADARVVGVHTLIVDMPCLPAVFEGPFLQHPTQHHPTSPIPVTSY